MSPNPTHDGMKKNPVRHRTWNGLAWSLAASLLGTVALQGAEPLAGLNRNVIGQGEIGRKDVYVRSGPSMNHYTICKLQPGDRVSIVGEQGEWFEILPPVGTFSLVSGEYVDSVDEKSGVINGENVRVRAGSSLNEQKYTVQGQLQRGAKVTILGRNPDGFVRIAPPPSATLWINRTFVESVPEGLLKLESHGKSGTNTAPSETGDPKVTPRTGGAPETEPNRQQPEVQDVSRVAQTTEGPSSASAKSESRPATGMREVEVTKTIASKENVQIDSTDGSALSLLPPSENRKKLEALETDVQAELYKPAAERQIDPLLLRYRAIADQNEDLLAKRYAEARMTQLGNMAELVATLRRIRELNEEADLKRRQFTSERTNLDYVTLPPIATGFDAQGELRVSALYPPGTSPRRYRLVDPQIPSGKTLGYVEIPSDSSINVGGLLGQYVGVRASEKRLQVGGVDPVPVFLARDVVALQPASPSATIGQE